MEKSKEYLHEQSCTKAHKSSIWSARVFKQVNTLPCLQHDLLTFHPPQKEQIEHPNGWMYHGDAALLGRSLVQWRN